MASLTHGQPHEKFIAGHKQKSFTQLFHTRLIESVEEYLAAIEDAQEKEWEFWEQLDGETPLGGEMRLSYKPKDDTTS